MEITSRIYLDLKDWDLTKQKLMDENLLQRPRMSTRKVASNESIKRVKNGTEWEMKSLCKTDDSKDKNFICLLWVSRQYELLWDLVKDLLRYRWLGMDKEISSFDIQNWFEILGEAHSEIAGISPGSMKKLLLNTKRILEAGGLLEKRDDNFIITYPGISYGLQDHLQQNGTYEDLVMLLKSDQEIKSIIEGR